MKYLWVITKDKEKGRVVYNSDTCTVQVTFPDPIVELEVTNYLNKDQVMWYPVGEGLDQDEPRLEPPTRGLTNMRMTMNGLLGGTGVRPAWKGQV